jgi:hypothetical protein
MGDLFKCKVVLIYLTDAPPEFSNGVPIQDPRLEKINDRAFVMGVVPNMEGDWAAGLPIGIAFDQIGHFIEFPTEREFLERSSLWSLDERISLKN